MPDNVISDGRIKRRKFLGRSFKLAGLVGLGGACWASYRFAMPGEVSLDDYLPGGKGAGSGESDVVTLGGGQDVTSVEIGAESIGVGESRIVAIGYTPVIVVRGAAGYQAFDATCAHLGCLVKWQPADNQFVCPCHAGRYDADGNRVSGPPPVGLRKCKVEEIGDKLRVSIS